MPIIKSYSNNKEARMIVSNAVNYFLEFHRNNSKMNTVKYYTYVANKFEKSFGEKELDSITSEDILFFLTNLTNGNKQNTKNSRYTVMKVFIRCTLRNYLESNFTPFKPCHNRTLPWYCE